ncbi:glycosyltransferase family 4 protein [Lacinutrix sp. C3R15]|uniref:glycosyltransferase family 4 protein n=1 Tax=Flavobacteriaceae TaxID=49546 RepID=UPI001C0965AB|nr:glycosyltransferase family 4 protein [Oceanihabitans sp. 1_MG-2023]MBU2939585.1 glycosyltransferase family 4 protein [Lacinutrix sp. C3R15]MDO6622899.1 glycosyltransferase family 4 protein [Oceanihabitans sp. 1_MG-2023]
MKILLLYTYNKGLLSNFFQELSGKLVTDGHEVSNFYFKHKKAFFIQEGIQVYGEKRGGYLYNYKNIYKVIKKTKPDVIISNFSYVNPALLFGKLLGVKKNIVWFHTVYEHDKPSTFKVYRKALFLKMADIVIANSEILQKEMQDIYGVRSKNTRCVPFWSNILNYRNSVSELNINKDSSVLKLGVPGRLLMDKNHQVVMEALSVLKDTYEREIHLYIAGGGPDKSKLEDIVDNLNLQKEVTFLGVLSVNEMIVFYETMDVLVLPSLNEAFGLVFIEAISLGRPVIVSSKFGALNFLDAEKMNLKDFCFHPNSVDELKELLVSYIENKGIEGEYFKDIYKNTFDKKSIYKQIKNIIVEK